MVARHEVTDEEWQLVDEYVTRPAAATGRPRRDARQMLNGVMWVLRTGAPWRDLPERFGPWETVYYYFNLWREDGTYDRVLSALQIRLDRDGHIDWDLWCIDGSNVRAARAAAGASKKVTSDMPTSPETTVWAARAADSGANSISLQIRKVSP